MALRCVLVPVAVRAGGHVGMGVQVVAVVMGVGVFVVQGFVRVFMRVGFGQVQQHAQQHQRAAGGQQPAAAALAHGQRGQRAYEGRKGKHRAGAAGAEFALGQQVQPQAQAVTRSAHGQQGQCRSGRRPGLAGQRRQRKAGRSADGGLDQHHLRRVALGHGA